MDKDYPSDSDQSDEDFCPENVECDDPSEEESDENCEESDGEQKKSTNRKTQRNRKRQPKSQKKTENEAPEEKLRADEIIEETNNDTDEKKRSDALWADFLNDVGSTEENTPKPRQQNTTVCPNSSKNSIPIEKSRTPKEPEKIKITEIFEFAGEEIKITKDVPIDKVITKSIDSPKVKTAIKDSPTLPKGPLKRPAAGLSSILSSINKKNKISVLEKSKLDWDGFKQKEGLSEELQTFNKGRDGYLERQDFLERTDLRQFEIEKSLRQTKRSNR